MFLSVALVKKKLWAILDFFSQTRLFFRPVPYPINKKKITKNPLNYDLLKVTQFHGERVRNESARTNKLQGGPKRRPPRSLFRVKAFVKIFLSKKKCF